MILAAGPSPGRVLRIGTLIGLGLCLRGWIGMLLLVAGTDLAMSRRPFSARPACWPAISVTAAGMLLVDPIAAFFCGWLAEISCDPAIAAIHASGGKLGAGGAAAGAADQHSSR